MTGALGPEGGLEERGITAAYGPVRVLTGPVDVEVSKADQLHPETPGEDIGELSFIRFESA